MDNFGIMPYAIQLECIEWFSKENGCSIPIVSMNNFQVSGLQLLHEGCSKFIVLSEKRHVMCCRVEGSTCIFMDTTRDECPTETQYFLNTFANLAELPSFITHVEADTNCFQQNRGKGGCTVMSLGNFTMNGSDSVTADEGECIRKGFATDLLENERKKSTSTAQQVSISDTGRNAEFEKNTYCSKLLRHQPFGGLSTDSLQRRWIHNYNWWRR
jgi:hypothetical protein